MRHGVRPPLQSHAHPWGLLRLAVSISGHRPWDGVIVYRLFICWGYHFTLLSLGSGWDSSLVISYYQRSILVEHVEFIACALLLSIIS